MERNARAREREGKTQSTNTVGHHFIHVNVSSHLGTQNQQCNAQIAKLQLNLFRSDSMRFCRFFSKN